MREDPVYYRGKIIDLFNKLFLNSGNAKTRFSDCEGQFYAAYLGSSYDGVPGEIKEHWNKIWDELNKKEPLEMRHKTYSSFNRTIQSKQNKSLEKYLMFILSEYSRITKVQ